MEQLFKAAAISSTNFGKVPTLAAVVINIAEFGMAFSRDAATHFLGLVFVESAGHLLVCDGMKHASLRTKSSRNRYLGSVVLPPPQAVGFDLLG